MKNDDISPQFAVVGLATYLSLASFLHLFIFNLVAIRMRINLISQGVKSVRLSRISSLHIQLCESINIFNSIYPVAIELMIFFSLASFAFALYEIYFSIIINAKDEYQLAMCAIINIWNLLLASSIVVLFYFCTKVKKEGEKIFDNLMKETWMVKNIKTRKRIWNFVIQMENLNPKIGHELYVVEWKLLLKVRI